MFTGPEKDIAAEVARLIHRDQFRDAARAVSDFCELDLKIDSDSPAKVLPPLQHFLHYCLNNGGLEEAAAMLWTPAQFTCEPTSVKQIWQLFDDSTMGLIMGAGSMGKSFSMGGRMFLEWIRDPEYTNIKLLGPSEDHLESNLFSHIVRLHQQAKLPMPGEVGELYVGLDRRNLLSSIKGVVIPVGKVKKAGRLQGGKRDNRSQPHPVFGALTRQFIFIDEIENVPGGLWGDIDNVLSNIQEEGVSEGFKIFGAYNPTNQGDEVAKRAEPPFGWGSFDANLHYRWKSIRGWDVLRLDGEKSENAVQNKVVYPGLQTRAGLSAIAKNAGGTNTAGYFSMGRGAYPPMGVELTVIPPGMIPQWIGEFIWLADPDAFVSSCDLALEGGAAAAYTVGRCGKATGMKFPPSLEHPTGRVVMFKNSMNQVTARWALQAEKQFTVPKGDTVKMKDQLIDINKKAGVRPEFFGCDRTGHGQGIADLMKNEWGQIHAINYSQSPSETKIMEEDTKTCKEEYPRIDSELWFALRKFGEFGYFLIHPQVDMSKLSQQLTQRKFTTGAGKSKVESKKEYKSRGFESPDEADSLTLFVHAARKGSGVIPSMKGNSTVKSEDDDGWYDGQTGHKIDFTNRPDVLEESIL